MDREKALEYIKIKNDLIKYSGEFLGENDSASKKHLENSLQKYQKLPENVKEIFERNIDYERIASLSK